MDGDSIAAGVGVTIPWPGFLNAPTKYSVYNIAFSGADCSAARTAYQSLLVPSQTNVLYIICGTNNIAGGQTGAQTYTALSGYISGARTFATANGLTLKIIVATMLSRDNPAGLDAERAAFNTAVRGNAAGADFVVDFDPTQLGCNSCATTSGLFNADKIHPNNAGEVVEVQKYQAVLP